MMVSIFLKMRIVTKEFTTVISLSVYGFNFSWNSVCIDRIPDKQLFVYGHLLRRIHQLKKLKIVDDDRSRSRSSNTIPYSGKTRVRHTSVILPWRILGLEKKQRWIKTSNTNERTLFSEEIFFEFVM